MNKFFYTGIVAALFTFTSCMEDQFSDIANSQNANKLENIQVSSDFNWVTSKTVSVHVVGLPTVEPVKSTLTIVANNRVYYSGFHALSDTLDFKVEVPATAKELTLKFGSIERTSAIVDGKLSFSYLSSTQSN